jgi:hypothetical protein
VKHYSPEAHLRLYEGLIQDVWRQKFGAAPLDVPLMAS